MFCPLTWIQGACCCSGAANPLIAAARLVENGNGASSSGETQHVIKCLRKRSEVKRGSHFSEAVTVCLEEQKKVIREESSFKRDRSNCWKHLCVEGGSPYEPKCVLLECSDFHWLFCLCLSLGQCWPMCIIIWAMYAILNIVVSTLRKLKETGKINFKNTF